MSALPEVREPTLPRWELKVVPAPPGPRYDLTRSPRLRRLLHKRWFQFALILPNQIIFWLVIVAGLIGRQVGPRNFATAITWYLWFCVVFVLMVGVGRGWCAMCPFGGAAEWLQRLTFFKRTRRSLGLGLTYPEKLARYGFLPAVVIFIVMTYWEEYFNIAGPGQPLYTSLLVLFIVTFAGTAFLVFERRTFCRYLCPLTPVIGTIGQMGGVAGFAAKDREVCLACETKECMRGSESGYGCPWYEYPGQTSSNSLCGLCSECFKNCPNENVGLFLQPPLASLYSGIKKRMDVAMTIVLMAGLVWFQQVNALPYASLTRLVNWLHYPNPLVFAASCLLPVPVLYALSRLGTLAGRYRSGGRLDWRRLFIDWAYMLIPLVGMDFLARQLPKLFDHVARMIAVISDPFGFGWNLFGTAHARIADRAILSIHGVVIAQVVVVALGLAGSLYAAVQIRRHTPDYNGQTVTVRLLQYGVGAAILAAVAGMQIWMYVLMQAAE